MWNLRQVQPPKPVNEPWGLRFTGCHMNYGREITWRIHATTAFGDVTIDVVTQRKHTS